MLWTYPSAKVYDMLLSAENFIRELESRGDFPEVATKLSLEMGLVPLLEEYVFKDCHRIKSKIIDYFLRIRITIFAHQRRTSIKEITSRTQSHRDSRSMFMRMALEG